MYFAAQVTIENEQGEQQAYQIVGPDEFDLKQNKLSMDSPLAKALLGKSLDDEFQWKNAEGELWYTIVDIRY